MRIDLKCISLVAASSMMASTSVADPWDSDTAGTFDTFIGYASPGVSSGCAVEFESVDARFDAETAFQPKITLDNGISISPSISLPPTDPAPLFPVIVINADFSTISLTAQPTPGGSCFEITRKILEDLLDRLGEDDAQELFRDRRAWLVEGEKNMPRGGPGSTVTLQMISAFDSLFRGREPDDEVPFRFPDTFFEAGVGIANNWNTPRLGATQRTEADFGFGLNLSIYRVFGTRADYDFYAGLRGFGTRLDNKTLINPKGFPDSPLQGRTTTVGAGLILGARYHLNDQLYLRGYGGLGGALVDFTAVQNGRQVVDGNAFVPSYMAGIGVFHEKGNGLSFGLTADYVHTEGFNTRTNTGVKLRRGGTSDVTYGLSIVMPLSLRY